VFIVKVISLLFLLLPVPKDIKLFIFRFFFLLLTIEPVLILLVLVPVFKNGEYLSNELFAEEFLYLDPLFHIDILVLVDPRILILNLVLFESPTLHTLARFIWEDSIHIGEVLSERLQFETSVCKCVFTVEVLN